MVPTYVWQRNEMAKIGKHCKTPSGFQKLAPSSQSPDKIRGKVLNNSWREKKSAIFMARSYLSWFINNIAQVSSLNILPELWSLIIKPNTCKTNILYIPIATLLALLRLVMSLTNERGSTTQTPIATIKNNLNPQVF